MDIDFGKYLKEKRLKKDYTINQLALYSGMSSAQLSRIENGKRGIPKAENIRKIATALSVPHEEMMEVAGYIEDGEKDKDKEFEAFKNDPSLERWYKELPKNSEEDLKRLRKLWEAFKEDE